jgi:hypothetical protein
LLISRKKAQSAAGAAGLIALIAVFIVLYLLLLPPHERANLLGDSPTSSSGSGNSNSYDGAPFTINKTSLSTSPGRIDYLKFNSYEHPLPSVNLYTTTSASVLTQEESLYVKNGVFDVLTRNVTFKIQDVEYIDNVLLSATTKKGQGMLRVSLNGNMIYEGMANPFPVINIDKTSLQPVNIISLEVSPVGWRFWTTNEYLLDNVQITGDITDVSEQASKMSFIVTDTEKFNLEKASLRFFPDCDPTSVGKLRVYINNQNIYSGIPDCTQLNRVDLSTDMISAGTNFITFKTDKGYYSIFQIKVDTELEKQTYPLYYFEIDNRLFVGEEEDKEESCGEVDGICPANCDEDLDRDCCFETGNMYWCDVVPNEDGDRCVAVVTTDICNRCVTGYEDKSNDAAEACEGLCGDDKDNICPEGCSKYYDEDCCFDESEDNYWCNDVPIYGISDVCKHSLTTSQCDDCPSNYKTKTGSSYKCNSDNELDIKALRNDFKAELVMRFIDDSEKKAAHVYVNGHKFYVNTYKNKYSKDISGFVEPGSNAVKIEPDITSIDIIELKIEVSPK